MSGPVAWLLAASSLAALAIFGVRLWWGWSSRRWPRVQARVVTSWTEVVPDADSGGSDRYRRAVLWSFTLQGRGYRGSTRSLPAAAPGAKRDRGSAAFAPGVSLWVYHHPRFPSRSVLEPGISLRDVGLCLAAAAALGWVLWTQLG